MEKGGSKSNLSHTIKPLVCENVKASRPPACLMYESMSSQLIALFDHNIFEY